MKWYIDRILNEIFTLSKKLFFFVIKFFWKIFTLFFNGVWVFLLNFSSFVFPFFKPFVSLWYFLWPIINYYLIGVPRWFLDTFIWSFFNKYVVSNFLVFFHRYAFFTTLVSYIFFFFKSVFNNIYTYAYRLYVFSWKKVIDFVFFDFWRNRGDYFQKFVLFFRFLILFFLLYIFLYINYFNVLYNYFFYSNLEYFFFWDTDTYRGFWNLFLCYINPDNLVLLFYVVFIKLGFFNLIGLSWDELYLYVGLGWTNTYYEFKVNNPYFCFTKYFVDLLFTNIYTSYSLGFEYNTTPIFFFFGFLFFTTVILSWFFFSYLGLYGIYKLNIFTLFFFWVSLLLSAKSVFLNQKVYIIKICNWAFLGLNVRVDYYFLIDTISFSFMLLTTTIAFFVFIYAFSYFRYEPLVDRFLLFILSFVISMIFLVTSGNTIMLFLGWELIGLTSFLLINFWTTKAATLKSAFKAFTFNKVSDFFMFMFLVSTYSVFYTFDILSINNQVFKFESATIYIFNTPINFLEFLAFTIMGAAFIKSAQIGGHVWLPDSMEAPVPASSLIHSATLVSAGVYLILRFNFIFDLTQFSKFVVPVIGSLTAAYGGVCAVAQSDIKKTLAYSTISHCGFLMVLCATEMNEFTILYLYVHGFFKAGVFMCVGNVLRITRGYQDTRRMGGLLKYLPFEYFCATVGLLNLAGLPFTFGFFIKHLLLISLDTYIYIYYFVVFNSLIGAFAGLFYSFRLISYTFNDFKKGHKVLYSNLNRSNYSSVFYTNSSLAATFSVFFLFVFSYLITYFMFKYFLYSNFLFSDFMNTTILTNYYSTLTTFNGYLLNFSYINLTVVVIIISLLFSKYRKTIRHYNLIRLLNYIVLIFLFFFLFYMFI